MSGSKWHRTLCGCADAFRKSQARVSGINGDTGRQFCMKDLEKQNTLYLRFNQRRRYRDVIGRQLFAVGRTD